MSKRLEEIHPGVYVTDDPAFPIEYVSKFGTLKLIPDPNYGEEYALQKVKKIQEKYGIKAPQSINQDLVGTTDKPKEE